MPADTQETLHVLQQIRRRLVVRLDKAMADQRKVLLDAAADSNIPFFYSADIQELITSLHQAQTAIDAIEAVMRRGRSAAVNVPIPAPAEADSTPARDDTFDRYIELVGLGRLEDAARELGTILRMPLDRMTTATRYFARAVAADPTACDRLANLTTRLKTEPPTNCMRLFVTTFGFQAIESQLAIQALRGRQRAAQPVQR